MLLQILLYYFERFTNQNKDYKDCKQIVDDSFMECIESCDEDTLCVVQCNRTYSTNLSNCPCRDNCPKGCPCPNYECPQEEPKNILILNSHKHNSGPPLLMNSTGWFKILSKTDVFKSSTSG